MSIDFARACRFFFLAAVVVSGAGCEFHEHPLPEIQKPLGYDTVALPLSGCLTPLPPVRADIECGAAEIGKSIDPKDVCHLLEALRTWVASGPADAQSVRPDDWSHVRAVCVHRSFQITVAEYPPHVRPSPPVRRWHRRRLGTLYLASKGTRIGPYELLIGEQAKARSLDCHGR